MATAAVVKLDSQSGIDEAFPNVNFGVKPTGSRILVQIRRPKSKIGSIILSEYTKEAEQDNTQVAKVISLGPLAFRNRGTMELWPEGAWYKEGDFVYIPKYAGSRWRRDIPGEKGEKVEFVIFNDLDVVGTVDGDPIAIQAHI